MRSPRRLSSPTTSERRRPRSEPSERPVSFMGIWTRRPSARIATATWRRLRPSNRPKVVSRTCPADPGGSRSLRGVECSRNHPGPMESRSSSSERSPSGPTAGPHRRSAIAVRNKRPSDGPTVSLPPLASSRRGLLFTSSAAPPRERERSWQAPRASAQPGRPEPSACESCRSAPAQTGAEGEGQRRDERHGPGEARQVRLHDGLLCEPTR
jgi:hypothetical protein